MRVEPITRTLNGHELTLRCAQEEAYIAYVAGLV